MKAVITVIKNSYEKPEDVVVEIKRRNNMVVIIIDEVEYLIPSELWGIYINDKDN